MEKKILSVDIPEPYRCAVSFTYDLEMCMGYSPVGINNGRIIEPVQQYSIDLCKIANEYSAKLHFFYVCNGFETMKYQYLKDILDLGHDIDSHTYDHQPVATCAPEVLDEQLRKANEALLKYLGISPIILRGPVGYKDGMKDICHENRMVILNNGFQYITGEIRTDELTTPREKWNSLLIDAQPYQYPEGLVEIPITGWTDRMWFDMRSEVDQKTLDAWRKDYGHKPVVDGWQAPWTEPKWLDEWIEINVSYFDYVYEKGMLWIPTWHPYTHYLHDRENKVLRTLLQHIRSQKEPVFISSLRETVKFIK